MSETQDTTTQENTDTTAASENSEAKQTGSDALNLSTLFAFKAGMSSYIDENGDMVAVTLLKLEPTLVTQVKTKETDGYEALQVAFTPKKSKRTAKSEANHLKKAGFEAGARHVREIRGVDVSGASVGTKIGIDGLAAGDVIKVTGRSKGKGFQGAVKRWNSACGPMSHGSGFHRQPGSAGNRTWPGRVMPGKHFPGHMGDETKTVKSQVIEVLKDENMLIVKGAIPGARNQLVKVAKV